MAETIVLTCASGKQASHVIAHLYDNPQYRLRLACHSPASHKRLANDYPKAEVVLADTDVPSACRDLLKGATTILHIGPSFHPHEFQIGVNMIDAATAESKTPNSKFQHFVYSSVLNPQFSKMLNHDRKKYVEEYLMETALNWTILQPAHIADPGAVRMLAAAKDPDPQTGKATFGAMFDPSIAFSFVVLRDLGAAIAKVIVERQKHYFAQYPLVSTGPTSYNKFFATMGKTLGTEYQVKQLPLPQAVDALNKGLFGTSDVDQRVRDGPERMLMFYNKRGLVGSPNVMEWLLGGKATSLEELARLCVEGGKNQDFRPLLLD